LLFVLFDKKKLQLTVQVCCLFYFLLLSRFFKRKLEWVFWWALLGFFSGLFKKNRVDFFGSFFFTTTLIPRATACLR